MNIGLRLGAWQSRNTAPVITARDYIQDGLTFQLDGIENEGFGISTANPVWIPLITDVARTIDFADGVERTSRGFAFRRQNSAGILNPALMTSDATLEVQCTIDRSAVGATGMRWIVFGGYSWQPEQNPTLVRRFAADGRLSYGDSSGNNIIFTTLVPNLSEPQAEAPPYNIDRAGGNTFCMRVTRADIGNGPYFNLDGIARGSVYGYQLIRSLRGFGAGMQEPYTSGVYNFTQIAQNIRDYINNPMGGSIQAIRVYNRFLSDAESVHNAEVDALRFKNN